MIDWNALEGWLITALLLLFIVAIAWWRRHRKNPDGFHRSWSRMPSDWRQPSDRFRPPH